MPVVVVQRWAVGVVRGWLLENGCSWVCVDVAGCLEGVGGGGERVGPAVVVWGLLPRVVLGGLDGGGRFVVRLSAVNVFLGRGCDYRSVGFA